MNLIDPHLIERLGAENRRLKAERLKLDKRIHNQRVALRVTWEIVEQRGNWLGSPASRRRYHTLWKMYQELRARIPDDVGGSKA